MSRPTIKNAQTLEYLQLFRTNASRCVMIRDLPFSCVNEDINNLCQEILGISPSLVHVLFDAKGCPLHYGYILFNADNEAHLAVSKMDRLRFRGRDIRFVPFNTAGSHERGRQGAVHVFFRAQGSLPSPITEETLRRFLEKYGELEHVIIRTYDHNAEGLVEGFGFVTFLDPNVHFRVCSEAKRLVFEGVAYDCTFSRQVPSKAPYPSKSLTGVPPSTHNSPLQFAQGATSPLPTSYAPMVMPSNSAPLPSYDFNQNHPDLPQTQPSFLSQTDVPGSYVRPASIPVGAGVFVNSAPSYVHLGYAPRPFHTMDGYQSPRGHAVIMVPSLTGVHQNHGVTAGQTFSYDTASLPPVGGYATNLPLSHGLPPSPVHAVHYSPAQFSVPTVPYQATNSMPTPPSTPAGVTFQYMPLPYPSHNVSPFAGPSTVSFGSSPPPFYPSKRDVSDA